MSYHNKRRFFSNETVEEKTRKYTRPHPVVTSHLRNMHYAPTLSWTPPQISNRGFVPNLMNVTFPPQGISQQPVMMNQFLPDIKGIYNNVSKNFQSLFLFLLVSLNQATFPNLANGA